ncbi:MAG: hypothetical protein KDB80_05970 [Planctomycetes bacterium]|nr:hypothetical protein [Planctomycetota bacterium]
MVQSRLLVGLLILLLQVVTLPCQSRLWCIAKSGSLECCCAAMSEDSAEGGCSCCDDGSSCCSDQGDREPADDDCHCGDGATSLVAVVADHDETPTFAIDLATEFVPCITSPIGACAGFAPAPEARARTGPPRYLVFEVFLI